MGFCLQFFPREYTDSKIGLEFQRGASAHDDDIMRSISQGESVVDSIILLMTPCLSDNHANVEQDLDDEKRPTVYIGFFNKKNTPNVFAPSVCREPFATRMKFFLIFKD